MKKGFLVRSILSVIGSYIVSLAFMALFAMLCVNMKSTKGVPEISGMAALFLGAFVCGLLCRKGRAGILSGVLSGTLYIALPLLVSFLSGGESGFSPMVRIGVFLLCALICIGISALPASADNRKISVKRRKNLLSKYMENH